MSGLGHVWLVGAGPGDPGLITATGLAALRRAEVVVYDRLAPPALLAEVPAEALLLDAGKAAGDHAMTQDEINAALVEHGSAGRRVVRLKGGDPFVFGRGGEEMRALVDAAVPCTVVPGVTSAIGGIALAGIPITHRGVASSFAVVTGHEDPSKPESAVDWGALATAVDTLVVLMGATRLEAITNALVAGGRSAGTPAAVVQSAGTPLQRTVEGTLEDIASVAAAAGVHAPALLVVGDVTRLRTDLGFATAAPLTGKRVLVTRSRRQASGLVESLRLEGAHPLEWPAIEAERRVDGPLMDGVASRLAAAAFDWVVLTSANAVEVLMDELNARGLDARVLGGARVAAIGGGTVSALRARGLIADLVPPTAVGESVVEALAASGDLAGASVLLPRAEGARDVVPRGLRALRAEVTEVPLYLAAAPGAPAPEVIDAVRRGEVDVVTFTSSSTVRNLVAAIGDEVHRLRGTTIACIGPVTAATAQEAGFEVAIVSDEASVDGLVAALREHFWQRRPVAAASAAGGAR